MSTNANPKHHTLKDETLRRTGARDLSGLTEEEADGGRRPLPNPRTDIDEPQVGGRGAEPPSDWKLHAGPPPGRIDRFNNARIFGLTSKNNFGQDEQQLGVGHVPVQRLNAPIMPNPSIQTADSMHIPAVKIGNPL